MTEEKRQHLEFIQNIINRLSTNSIQLKAITITLTAGLLAIYSTSPKIFLIYLASIQVVFFWLLDSYYLQQERKFRGVYNDVSGITTSNFTIKDYEMPIEKYKEDKYNFFRCIFSLSKLLFFGSIFLILILTIVGLEYNCIN
ncbi:hypothetical protein ABH942_001870 [Flavobacterium sp. 28YEA47A]|uniref:hypothetical protein n=1 Tax=Flavobacterium sp. 28YEA47A TaxID=3156276 RepID=UPI003512E5C9